MALVANKYEKKRLRMLAALVPDGVILDVGCAHMPNPQLCTPSRHVIGTDIELPAGDLGYQEFLQGDVFELSKNLAGRQMDCVVAGEFIEHVEQPYELLRMFKAILKPGGVLLLSTPNPVGFPSIVFEWGMSKTRFYTEHHTFYFSPRWVLRMLERSGFQIEKTLGCGVWPIGIPCPMPLAYQVIYVARA